MRRYIVREYGSPTTTLSARACGDESSTRSRPIHWQVFWLAPCPRNVPSSSLTRRRAPVGVARCFLIAASFPTPCVSGCGTGLYIYSRWEPTQQHRLLGILTRFPFHRHACRPKRTASSGSTTHIISCGTLDARFGRPAGRHQFHSQNYSFFSTLPQHFPKNTRKPTKEDRSRQQHGDPQKKKNKANLAPPNVFTTEINPYCELLQILSCKSSHFF